MSGIGALWLVTNAASGSNDAVSLAAVRADFDAAKLQVQRITRFPEEPLPTAGELDAKGIGCLAVFAGDGTVNALVTSLYGWGGAVLVLPGGTMNLTYRRLHGERPAREVLAKVAAGEAHRCRPGLLRCAAGDGLSGILAGPGTEWNQVREAIRHNDLGGIAAGTAQAIDRSVKGPMITCAAPRIGREEGYPLIMLTPGAGGFAVDAYHSETPQDYLAQGLALLRRDFRKGPHEALGEMASLALESTSGEAIGLLVDGEPAEAGPRAAFELVSCEVDLLATEAQ